jgi:ABC-type dipeptide/oligopeptide/nickel transport system ATPase component
LGDAELIASPEAVRAIRWRRASIVLQDAMNAFNPVMTVGEQIAELFVYHEGAVWETSGARARALLERVGLSGSLTRAYPHELSGGMRQRAALAMAIALSPDLVIVDEPTSALDVVTACAIARLLGQLRGESGVSLLVVSHDISLVARTCDRVAVMRDGLVVERGPVSRVLRAPTHDYTRGLIEAVARLPAAEGG